MILLRVCMNNNYEKIHLMLTGGTIDSEFEPSSDTTKVSKKPKVPLYLAKLKLHNKIIVTTVFLKDSREIRYLDRKELLKAIQASSCKLILITHGTYTMPDTAQYIKDQIGKTDKTIVFVGSMVPLSGFEYSDAAFNLGYAVAQLQTLPPGIYVCMNGKVFDPESVDKNKIVGRFEEVK